MTADLLGGESGRDGTPEASTAPGPAAMLIQPYHPSFIHAGVTHDLAHLNPFHMTVDSMKAGRQLRVHVVFTNHCFSENFDPAIHGAASPLISRQQPPRVFNQVRYDLSKQLPPLIHAVNHPKAQVRQTAAGRNWVHSVCIDTPAGPYHVFFVLRRESREENRRLQDLNMTVESAYPQGDQPAPQVRGRIGFVLLAGKTFLGEPVATSR